MKKEVIVRLHASFEELAQTDETGGEFWLARDLQELLGYAKWENFAKVIERAKTACRTSGHDDGDHFLDVRKMIELGKTATRPVDDVALTRYACYLVAQNGDPSKEAIFARLRSRGDVALFGGHTTQDMKHKLGVPESRPLADFLPTITIKAKDFANEITNFNIKRDSLRSETGISEEHVKNNKDVRDLLMQRGIQPEALPPAEDIKKIERRALSEAKNLPAKKRP